MKVWNQKKSRMQMWKKTTNVAKWLIVLFTLTISINSCNKRPTGVLNNKEMENLMYDMHLLEGSLRAQGQYNDSHLEKKEYYDALFKKYGITRENFDSCLSWYTRHPKDFERIYKNISVRVDTLTAEIRRKKFHPEDNSLIYRKSDLWRLQKKYKLTKDSTRTKLPFEIKDIWLLAGDVYVLSFLQRIAPSDSSKNPHVILYVNYWNGKVDSIRIKTHNDSILRRYKLKFKARYPLKVKSLSGFLLGCDSSKGKMNAYLDSITLLRIYNPSKQDSIRQAIGKMDDTKSEFDSIYMKRKSTKALLVPTKFQEVKPQ